VIPRLALGLILLVGVVLAAEGTFSIGQNISGSGEYFIGLGESVTVGDVRTVVAAAGKEIFVEGSVGGDAYLFGDKVVINGSIAGSATVTARTLVVRGKLNKATVSASEAVIEGSVEELNCDCGELIIKKGGKVGLLTGQAKEVRLEGVVGTNNLTEKKEEGEQTGVAGAVAEWLKGLISMLVLAFLMRKRRVWRLEDFTDIMTYVYGLLAYISPILLFILFLLALILSDLPYVMLSGIGTSIALFGLYLILVMLAGLPVYDYVGGRILRPFNVDNFYANVGVAYTFFYVIGLLFPVIWIFVTISGLGILLRSLQREKGA